MSTDKYTLTAQGKESKTGAVLNDSNNFEVGEDESKTVIDGTLSEDKTKYTTTEIDPEDPENTIEIIWTVTKEATGGRRRRSSKKSKKSKKSSRKSKKGGKKSKKTRKH